MPARRVFDAFSDDEVNAIWLGLLVLRHTGEEDGIVLDLLDALTERRAREIVIAADPPLRKASQLPVEGLDREALRAAIRDERKLAIAYVDGKSRATERLVWPLDHTPFGPSGAMLCWCEKRGDFRNFRFDRITSCRLLPERMPTPRAVLAALAERLEGDDDGW